MNEMPPDLLRFLDNAGWEGAQVAPLAGDASFRRYFRVRRNGEGAMLMHAPPPHEDPRPFLHVARYLSDQGLRAPQILAASPEQGWVLIEDFGDHRMREWLDAHPEHERDTYRVAIDTLVELPPARK